MSNPMDFWWFPNTWNTADLFLYVGHHPAVRDEVEPIAVTWDHSLDDAGAPSSSLRLYPISFVEEWRNRWSNKNVHRSIALYTASGDECLRGPFLVDIDNSHENLDDALAVAKGVVGYFVEQRAVNEQDMRIFFSGRKGFHVEVRPTTLQLGNWPKNHDFRCNCDACAIEDDLICWLRQGCCLPQSAPRNHVSTNQTVIDPIHQCIRLAGSLNTWLDDDGELVARRKIHLTRAQLETFDAERISSASQVTEGDDRAQFEGA